MTPRRALLAFFLLAEAFLIWASVVVGGWVYLDAVVGALCFVVMVRTIE